MPLVYADTSALFAFFHPKDMFALPVTSAAQTHNPDFVNWEFLQYELRHNLRQARTDEWGEIAWRALNSSLNTTKRLRWHSDLTASRILDAAEELSADKAASCQCGAGDFIHVAAAKRLNLLSGIDEFWTCDAAQAGLAKAVGLKTRLFELKRPSKGE